MDVFLVIIGLIGLSVYLFGIWYVISCYFKKEVATIVILIILIGMLRFFIVNVIEPKKEEMNKHIYKSLHI